MKQICLIVILLIMIMPAQAQNQSTVLLLGTSGGTLEAASLSLPAPSLLVDINPRDPARFARVDTIGMLRFIAAGTSSEGVYSFSPYFDGYSAPSAAENRLAISEAVWSPNGEMIAFRIATGDTSANDGVWFWQPARELSTDPSYHILRDCPPGCSLVVQENAVQWRSVGLEWSGDNAAILVSLRLPLEDNRRALTVRYAARDMENAQTRTGPQVLRYDTGHWGVNGQRIIVSGRNDAGAVVFGSVDRDGGNPFISTAASIGMGWVQDAVQNPQTGQIMMLGAVNAGDPLQLIDHTGSPLTDPIGDAVPQVVSWNRDRSAVMLEIGSRTYVAQPDGTITDITELASTAGSIDWVDGALPSAANRLALTQPAPEEVSAPTVVTDTYYVGQLLQVVVPRLDILSEPLAGATLVATVEVGEAVIITDGPLSDGQTIWWKIQTLDHGGWVPQMHNGQVTLAPPDAPTG